MNSSPVLCQQSPYKIRREFQRMKNEHNIKQAEPKLSKAMSSLHLSNKNGENKDPAQPRQKPPLQSGGSRLPVLAKSLKLQVPSEFRHSHNKWEEQPLAVKARRKTQCTRPVPFNFSQPRTKKRVAETREPLTTPITRTRATQPEYTARKTRPVKHQDVLKNSRDSVMILDKSHGKAAVNAAHPSGQPSAKLKTSDHWKNPLPTSDNTVNANVSISSTQAHLHQEVILGGKKLPNTPHGDQTVSVTTQASCSKPLNEKSEDFQPDPAALSFVRNKGVGHANQPTVTPKAQRVPMMKSQQKDGFTTEKTEAFQPDDAALLSILRNEGIGQASQPVTPKQSKQYNYLPQRVSIMKSKQKDGCTTGPVKSVQFSPDVAALQSILQNEGIKATGASRTSVCPPGRGTSVYKAQRVPVKKSCPDSTSHSVVRHKQTPQTKATPMRVGIKPQVMSAMKWDRSPYGSLTHGRCKSNINRHPEEVVQRLFNDPEDDQSTAGTDSIPSTVDKIPVAASPKKPLGDEKVETQRCSHDNELMTFHQAPPRMSVICFSTGKKLLRVPLFENQEGSALQEQNDSVSSERREFTTTHNVSEEPAHQSDSASQRLHKDFITEKACSLNPAVAMLRKRFPPLEERLLDEEVDTYTSVFLRATEIVSPWPRCGNPLASVLHFEESTRFIPIDFGLSPCSSSVFGSSQHER